MSVLRGEAVWGFGLAFLLAPGALQCDLAVGTELQFELNGFTFDMASVTQLEMKQMPS